MSLFLDALILVCIAFCVISGIRNGFVRSIMGLCKGAVSLIVAYAYTPLIAGRIREDDPSGVKILPGEKLVVAKAHFPILLSRVLSSRNPVFARHHYTAPAGFRQPTPASFQNKTPKPRTGSSLLRQGN